MATVSTGWRGSRRPRPWISRPWPPTAGRRCCSTPCPGGCGSRRTGRRCGFRSSELPARPTVATTGRPGSTGSASGGKAPAPAPPCRKPSPAAAGIDLVRDAVRHARRLRRFSGPRERGAVGRRDDRSRRSGGAPGRRPRRRDLGSGRPRRRLVLAARRPALRLVPVRPVLPAGPRRDLDERASGALSHALAALPAQTPPPPGRPHDRLVTAARRSSGNRHHPADRPAPGHPDIGRRRPTGSGTADQADRASPCRSPATPRPACRWSAATSRRGEHGARDSLYLSFSGEARFRNGTVTVAGDLVLDLATGGILRLRLTQPHRRPDASGPQARTITSGWAGLIDMPTMFGLMPLWPETSSMRVTGAAPWNTLKEHV